MKQFMDKDFLLDTNTAKWLYHDIASTMPIVDFHNHLDAKEIYENKNYKNITEVWLAHDHYKWRAMRSNGVDEHYITGSADDYEKYLKWCETMPRLIGSPLLHWNHLEMQRYFDYYEPLSERTAKDFWDIANAKLAQDDFLPRELLAKMNVVDMCTTNDPIEDLEYHKKLSKEEKRFKVRPTFRPDKAMNIMSDEYSDYIKNLEHVVNRSINSYDALIKALYERMDYFETVGCYISDHSLEGYVYYPAEEITDDLSEENVNSILNNIFKRKINGEKISEAEGKVFRSSLLVSLSKSYHDRKWIMQLHIGAMRNNSSRHFHQIGPDSGFDSIDDYNYAAELSNMLDDMNYHDLLPKTIIYNLNSKDNPMIATIIGNFQNEKAKSKIQMGAAWWFQDHKRGMQNQLQSFAESGVLSNFVGMVTDSRSMLSFPRHEYFRRILCNYIGGLVESGEYPNSKHALEIIIKDICYNNIMNFMK